MIRRKNKAWRTNLMDYFFQLRSKVSIKASNNMNTSNLSQRPPIKFTQAMHDTIRFSVLLLSQYPQY